MEFETELHPHCAVQRVALTRMGTGEPVPWQWVRPSPSLPLGEPVPFATRWVNTREDGDGRARPVATPWVSPPRHYPWVDTREDGDG